MILWGCPDELQSGRSEFYKHKGAKQSDCREIVDMTDGVKKTCATYWHCSGPVKYEIRKVKP